tara:strand:- start:192 stop:1199 length:1008 start_codon:yes stop_codon:yes gene_type:complete
VKNVFPYIVYAAAFALASSAAYYSVFGLSKLFSAQALAVVILAGTLEVSKLITASYLHQYWKRIGLLLKTYFVTAVFVLMFITSVGIYGFLVSSYQTTADQLTVLDKQVDVIELRRERFQTQLDEYSAEKKQLIKSISELSNGLSNNVIQYRDQETGEIITTTSSATRRVLERQLDDSKQQRNTVNLKIESLTDSVTSLDLQVLDIESNNDVAAELGPLRYVAELTGKPMNQIVNWFILIFIFVFDPLAVTLLIAAQIAIKKTDPPKTDADVNRLMSINEDELNDDWDSTLNDGLDDILAAEEFEATDIEWLQKQAEQEDLYQEKKKTNRSKIIS